MKKFSFLLVPIILSLTTSPIGTAHADEYSASEDSGRRGLLLGFGIQGGHIRFECDNDDCGQLNESLGVDLHAAYMLGSRLAISLDGWAMGHRGEYLGVDTTVTHTITTIGPQFWIVPRLWVRGGLGWAWARSNFDAGPIEGDYESENVLGVMGGVGFEVLSSPHFALDIQARFGTGFYDGVDLVNAGLGVGFTWF